MSGAVEVSERDIREFFDTASVVISAADQIDRELALRLGSRFNVIDWISPNENRVSDILQDLLDPRGTHGQGQVFLQAFLRLCAIDESWLAHSPRVNVYREHRTMSLRAPRRIDLLARFDVVSGPRVVAIENKPWAGEQHEQMSDYARYLERTYGEDFHLVYLSGDGRRSSTLGDSEGPLDEAGRLHVVPYNDPVHSGDGRLRTLRDWAGRCADLAEADKLRWFLRDLSDWIARNFEGSNSNEDDLDE